MNPQGVTSNSTLPTTEHGSARWPNGNAKYGNNEFNNVGNNRASQYIMANQGFHHEVCYNILNSTISNGTERVADYYSETNRLGYRFT